MRLIVLQIVAEIPVAENGGKLIGRGTKLEEEKKSGREKKKKIWKARARVEEVEEQKIYRLNKSSMWQCDGFYKFLGHIVTHRSQIYLMGAS